MPTEPMINHQEQDSYLILDGINETIFRSVHKYHENNQKLLVSSQQISLGRKEEERKRIFATAFIDKYTKIFKITHSQLGELVNSLKTEDVLVLDSQLTEVLQKRTLLSNIGSATCLGTFLLSITALLSGSENWVFTFLALFMFTSSLGWMFPLMMLSQNFYGKKEQIHEPYCSAAHLALRRYLKNKYGPGYFPYQEIKRQLEEKENKVYGKQPANGWR